MNSIELKLKKNKQTISERGKRGEGERGREDNANQLHIHINNSLQIIYQKIHYKQSNSKYEQSMLII